MSTVKADWSVNCPQIVDVQPTSAQPLVTGFSFTGTGQRFTRLSADGRTPVSASSPVVGCYDSLGTITGPEPGWQIGVIVGPAVGGILISSYSISVGYAADIATFIISIALIAFMKNIPPSHEAEAPSLSALIDGVKYAFSRKDLLGTYLIDLAAMFFAMPTALIPFWAGRMSEVITRTRRHP